METIQNSIETRLLSSQLLEPSFLIGNRHLSCITLRARYESTNVVEATFFSFLTIASVAADYYALQVTSIPCEHAFSVANHTINLTRNCLLEQMTRAFLCLKNWLKTSVLE
ncbi:zinc finger bed domain-containing protein ricesleeper 2-like [Gigaspora margarita]|uniref:Zinc finger bed domain-containing protein ricesleeper 2-like n=1 Tax=Gigaspora margarita TaxID=4874 RepID=A0A8H3XBQ9_GIGMA|nr:zinc finger bed domain-containing protein ricesleeper 2-like [Gigaspora margarita]